MATNIYSGPFWKGTAERAIKTAIQTFIPLAGGTTFNILGLDWQVVGYGVLSAVVLSVLTSLLSGLNGTGPSAVDSEIKTDAVILDEVEIDAVEAQKLLDQMVIDGEVPDQETPLDDEPEDGLDAEPEGEADDEVPAVIATEDEDEGDAEPEGPADDEDNLEALAAEEVDLTPPSDDYRPRH